VDLLTVWQIRQRSRALERAVADPSEVHIYDRPDKVVVAQTPTKPAKGIAHQQPDDEDEPIHTRRKGPKSQRALENNGRYPEDRR
jgi:hypothetical protein